MTDLTADTPQVEPLVSCDGQRRPVVAVVAGGLLTLIVVAAIAAPWIAPHDPLDQDLSTTLSGPSADHWLGTDEFGRDALSRVLFAARISLMAGAIAVGVAVVIGVPLGMAAGYLGGLTDRLIMRTTDVLMALPGLILVIAFIAVLGKGLTNAMIALGIVLVPVFVRLAQACTRQVRSQRFIDGARVAGLSSPTIVRRHVVRNIAPAIAVQVTVAFGIALLTEAGLSFIGLGVQPPDASWGAMLFRGSRHFGRQAFVVVPPGLAIVLTVLACNLLADALRVGAPAPRRPHRTPHREATRAGNHPESALRPDPSLVLRVRDLTIDVVNGVDASSAVRSVDLDVRAGQVVGLVGESGCGKSLTATAVLGLLPPNLTADGSIHVVGRQVIGAGRSTHRAWRGHEVGTVFQDPTTALNPAFTAGDQIAEVLRTHLGLSRRDARRRAVELLERVGIPNAARRFDAYPHELSGGMAQRVAIAIAVACGPRLLIADEPTTALDVTIQQQILDLLLDLRAERGMSILLVTHDLGVVAAVCDEIAVMYAGELVEHGGTNTVLDAPSHPYTQALIAALPTGDEHAGLRTIPGTVPAVGRWPVGCRFAPRCPYRAAACADPVPLFEDAHGVAGRCVLAAPADTPVDAPT